MDDELICSACKLPIHRTDTRRYAGRFVSHDPHRCMQLLLLKLDSERKANEEMAQRLIVAQERAKDWHRVADERAAQLNQLMAKHDELMRMEREQGYRLGTCREALECLLPGLMLDLRYASDDDDRDALRSRVKTVTDALESTGVQTSYTAHDRMLDTCACESESDDPREHAAECPFATARIVERQEKNADAVQAKLDAVMLEHCPDEMTPEQVAEWARHQRAVSDEQGAEAIQPQEAPAGEGEHP